MTDSPTEPSRFGFIGKRFFMAILGAIIGIVMHHILAKQTASVGGETNLFGKVTAGDLISLAIPLILLVFLKRFSTLFITWFATVLAIEVWDNIQEPLLTSGIAKF